MEIHMEPVLLVKNISKTYPAFQLQPLSFQMERGTILGLIGRNGAGKTTLLKSLLNIVHPDEGIITYFGLPFSDHEWEIKQKIGFVSGGFPFYSKKKLRTITKVTRSFYPNWDNGAYHHFMDLFRLSEEKTPDQLSAGMRVKYALTLALSHHAELLLLDEPTSGLDPVSREELLDCFLALSDKNVSILFSTHITSDLEKCADQIVYLQNGHIRLDAPRESLFKAYRLLHLTPEQYRSLPLPLIGCKRSKYGYTALLPREDLPGCPVPSSEATLEEIMIHLEQEANHEAAAL
jgi:ABC-2 type transport system ATP-binding protein